MTTDTIAKMTEWITKNERTLGFIARKFDLRSMDSEDIFHNMIVALLENAKSHPEFADQSDAYKYQYAKWYAGHLLEIDQNYTRYVNEEGTVTCDEDGSISTFDLMADATQVDPAELIEGDNLLAAVKTLSPENQLIVKLLYVGYSKSEISGHLKISRPAVSQRLLTIQKALAEYA